MENGNKIGPKEMINYLNENNIDIYCLLCNFSMLDCILGTLSELEIEQIEKNIGEIENVYQSEEKEDGQCIRTTIAHFLKHGYYIKEIAIGECHYSDVCIDGSPDETNYFVVEPKEILRIEYIDKEKI